ncbi:exodeoxyribonuclease-3 [Sinorhizobium medicae]
MKIATWNINGVKARLDGLVGWLKESNPDIACLQEIKSIDDAFPRGEIESLGYHVETHGQKGFNGVALLSKLRPDEVNRGLPGDASDEQSRFIEGVFSVNGGALRVCCLYLPNGNPVETEKYPYKLAWMRRLAAFAEQRLMLEEPLILAGDYNVIPEPHDCWDVKVWRNDALYLPETRAAFRRLRNLGFTDAVRATSRRGAALFVLGLSGRLLAEESRHPHRPPDAVAGGGRQARVDLYREARPILGKAVRPRTCDG